MDTVEQKDGYVLLHVRVQPKASRNAIVCESEGRIRIALTAPPSEGAANRALCALVAKTLGLSKSAVSLVAGHKARDKSLRLDGTTRAAVLRQLTS